MDFNAACGDAQKQDKFKQDFIHNMANMLGCHPSEIVINKLSEGSVIVNFTFQTNNSSNSTPGIILYSLRKKSFL